MIIILNVFYQIIMEKIKYINKKYIKVNINKWKKYRWVWKYVYWKT